MDRKYAKSRIDDGIETLKKCSNPVAKDVAVDLDRFWGGVVLDYEEEIKEKDRAIKEKDEIILELSQAINDAFEKIN